ncbi:Translationally-controlled tumor protein [Sesamum angolense]|uniref:Translationally-controlled tumor protein n=1 Tax=Sesamum angolense TaxID=2727404 RepID=A0AAE2BX19_9LAMI|nr:Translationally-controlled tumor protein [Sesamum angolense]
MNFSSTLFPTRKLRMELFRMYIKLLSSKLEREKQEEFQKAIEGATKYLLSKIKDLNFFLWERAWWTITLRCLVTTRKVMLIQHSCSPPMGSRKSSVEVVVVFLMWP